MNIQQIKYVIAVEKLRSFGEAAKECYISQPTLSTMIARYEEEIGVIIFDRKTKPVTVTKEGKQIVQQLKILANEFQNLDVKISNLKGELVGKIKVGVIPTIAPYLLPRFLNEWIGKLPKMQFEISELTTDKIIEGIKHRDIDIGIASTPLKEPDLIEHHLYDEPFLLYDKSGSGLKHGFNLKEIDINRLWLLEEGHCMKTQTETICGLRKKRKINSNLEYKSGSIDTLLRFVEKYNGITLLPLLSTTEFPLKNQKLLKEFKSPVPARSVGLIVHKHFIKQNVLAMLKKDIIKATSKILDTRKPRLQLINPI